MMTDDFQDDLYNDTIQDHAECSDFRGEIPEAPYHAEAFNPLCGDEVNLHMIVDEEGKVADIKYSGQGCMISQASASMMAEALKGRTVEEARELLDTLRSLLRGKYEGDRKCLGDLASLEAVSKNPVRVKCAALAWSALEDVLKDYRNETVAASN